MKEKMSKSLRIRAHTRTKIVSEEPEKRSDTPGIAPVYEKR